MKSQFEMQMEQVESECRKIERNDLTFFLVLWAVCAVVLAVALSQ